LLIFLELFSQLEIEDFLICKQRNWHPMNIQYMLAVEDVGNIHNRKICYLVIRKLFAFIITMYEFDKFTKILLVTNLKIKIEKQVMNLLDQEIKQFILRWLPGMLTSGYVICRGVRLRLLRKVKKRLTIDFPIIKICRLTIYKLRRLPSLFLLSSVMSYCKVAALEASKLRIFTIGILDSDALPIDINFYIPADSCSNFKRLNLFLYLIRESMKLGKENGLKYKKAMFIDPITIKKKLSLRRKPHYQEIRV